MSIPVRKDCTYEPLPDFSSHGEIPHAHVDCDETPQQSGLHTYAPESGKGNKQFIYFLIVISVS